MPSGKTPATTPSRVSKRAKGIRSLYEDYTKNGGLKGKNEWQYYFDAQQKHNPGTFYMDGMGSKWSRSLKKEIAMDLMKAGLITWKTPTPAKSKPTGKKLPSSTGSGGSAASAAMLAAAPVITTTTTTTSTTTTPASTTPAVATGAAGGGPPPAPPASGGPPAPPLPIGPPGAGSVGAAGTPSAPLSHKILWTDKKSRSIMDQEDMKQRGGQNVFDNTMNTKDYLDEKSIEPENSLRKKFFLGGGDGVKQTKEQEIINELAFNSFDYVRKNGYLGENKVSNYKVENDSLQFDDPLGVPRSFEMNHGPVPLPEKLSSFMPMSKIKKYASHVKNKKRRLKKFMSHAPMEILPSDLNNQAATHCLRNWKKESPFHFVIDTEFKLTPAFDGDIRKLSKVKMKSIYDTQWNPMQGGEHFGMFKENTSDYIRYKNRQHNCIAY